MAFTAYRTWVAGEVVTAALMNAQVRDNGRYLKGQDGPATFEDDLTVDNLVTAGLVDGIDVSAHDVAATAVHGAGGNTIIYSDHSNNTTTAHGAVSAATASKFVVRDADARAKFAAPGAAGDALIKGTRIALTDMAALTTDKYWKGVGGIPAEADLPGGTKEFLAIAAPNGALTRTTKGILIDAVADEAVVTFLVPQDFTTLTSVEAIFLPGETGADMHYSITTYWSAYNGGEAWNVHSETAANQDMGATVADQNLALDISGFLDVVAMAAGDVVIVKIIGSTTAIDSNFYFVGVRFKYS